MENRLKEASGLVASRRHAGVFWSLNDSKNAAEIFALDATGRALGVWAVAGSTNVDWEEISTDDGGRLFIADTGDNDRQRDDQRIVIVDEPDPASRGGTIPVVREIRIRFPHGHRNCEAMFISRESILLIEKLGKPAKKGRPAKFPDGPAALYRLSLGDSALPATDSRGDVVQVAAAIEQFDFAGSVTAADVSRDGQHVAVLTSQRAYVFTRDGPEGAFLTRTPWSVAVDCGRAEGICFAANNAHELLIVNEDRQLFRLQWP